MGDYPQDSFIFYRSFRDAIGDLSTKEQLETLLAICDYALYGIEPSLKGAPKAIFTLSKPNLDANLKRRKNGKKGGRPPKETNGSDDENHRFSEKEPNVDANGDVDVDANADAYEDGDADGGVRAPTPTKPVRKGYGKYGWVKLTDGEYSRLSNDLGQAEFERCIAYIDEAAQSTGNKNKWRDWNLVIRRCHRDGWGMNRGTTDTKNAVKTAADYDDGEAFLSCST